MDELQDAIEDAQYVNAIACADDGPRPIVQWNIPTDLQLEEWKVQKNDELAKKIEELLGGEKPGESKISTTTTTTLDTTDTEWTEIAMKDAEDALSLPRDQDKVVKPMKPQDVGSQSSGIGVAKENADPDKPATSTPLTSATSNPVNSDILLNCKPLESYEYVCSQPLGFFLFAQYVKDVRNDYLRMNFVEDATLYRRTRGAHNRAEKAREIALTYLVYTRRPSSILVAAGYRSSSHPPRSLRSSLQSDDVSMLNMDKELIIQEPPNSTNGLPKKKDIVELDLCRSLASSVTKLSLTSDELSGLLAENLDSDNRECLVGVCGPALQKALSRCGIPVRNLEETEFYVAPDVAVEESKLKRMPSERKMEIVPLSVDRHDSDELEELRASGDRDIFDEIELIVMESLKQQYWEDFLASTEYRRLLNFWWYRDRKVIEDDFYLMRVLGRGGFGLVHACKKGTSGKLFAMKVMNKKRIKMKKSEQLALNELHALAAVDSPFVVKLSYAFQSKENIFLILDLMTGGNLGFHLHQRGRFSKRECLYFSARIMLGLQALHDRDFVYRDLKPENVLVADDGRVKLSDLGLATKITPTLHGAAGTRGYWAPEMLRRDHKGRRTCYGRAVDWFSFGCCLYEFISGYNPFRSQEALRFGMKGGMESKEKALDCATLKMDPLYDPSLFDHDAADLCVKLLDKNEITRLGKGGCQEIMDHPYYLHINWEAIISDRMKPPFIPPKDVNAASQSEIGTFALDKTYHDIVIEPKDEEMYKAWDWTNPSAFDAEVIEFLIHERRIGKPLLPKDPLASCCCTVL